MIRSCISSGMWICSMVSFTLIPHISPPFLNPCPFRHRAWPSARPPGQPHLFPGPAQPHLHRALRDAQDFRYFLYLVSLYIMQVYDGLLLHGQLQELPQRLPVLRCGQAVLQVIDADLRVPELEPHHIPADIGGHPDQPGLLMLLVMKVRRFLQIPAERILDGILDILLVAEYDDAYPIEHVAVFCDCLPYVVADVHVSPTSLPITRMIQGKGNVCLTEKGAKHSLHASHLFITAIESWPFTLLSCRYPSY